MNQKEIAIKTRTIRRFKQIEIKDEDIRTIFENVRLVPSANNLQTLRYIVLKSREEVLKMQGLVKYAGLIPNKGGFPKEDQYPMAYIIINETVKSKFADVDAGIAAHAIVTNATELGLGSIMFGSHNEEEVKEVFNLKDNETPRLIIGLGYPDHESEVVDAIDGKVVYYKDDNDHWYVPKRSIEELVEER